MDPLEKRIRELQEDLEKVEQPDRRALWERIRTQPAQKGRRVYLTVRWLAAACVLCLCAVGVWRLMRADERMSPATADLPQSWQTKIGHYQQQITDREKKLQLHRVDRAAYGEWLGELALIDSLQSQFHNDMRALPKDERTAEHLARYYERKIRILELFSKEIQLQEYEKQRIVHSRG